MDAGPAQDQANEGEARTGGTRPGWPVVEGRYRVGNPDSPVAVCSMASVDMELPMERIAIMGKCVTENIGVEKIVKNIVSNPGIRYLVLCGQPSKGHFVDNAIESLVRNGVDQEKRIIGARGAMPVLKNLTGEEIERFRKQVTPINLSGEMDKVKILQAVGQYSESRPGEMQGGPVRTRRVENIVARGSDDVMDPKGFFIIHISPEKGEILVEHHTDSGLQRTITGKAAEVLYKTIMRLGLVSRMDHAAYLGEELAKAEFCINNDLDYEQDSDIFVRDGGRTTHTERPGLDDRRTYTIAGGKKVVIREFKKDEKEREFEGVLRGIGMGRSF